MFKIKTDATDCFISVSIIDLVKFLFSNNTVSRPVIIESHFNRLEKLRQEGFADMTDARKRLCFMPNTAQDVCISIKDQIQENRDKILSRIDFMIKVKHLSFLLIPLIFFSMVATVMSMPVFAIASLTVMMVWLILLLILYSVAISSIAKSYYVDGQLRCVLMHADIDCQYNISYDLTLSLF